jgi:hypothetical protein
VLLSAKDAAAVVGQKSPGGVYRKMDSGELPFFVVNGQRMVERDGLEARWASITRQRTDSPKPKKQPATSAEAPPTAPTRKRPTTTATEPPEPTETPDYNEERAWHEREKRLIAELDRRQKARELVYKSDVEQAQMAVALTLKNQLEALPKQVKQQLPHLSISDEEMIERLVAKVLTAVADWRMDQEDDE